MHVVKYLRQQVAVISHAFGVKATIPDRLQTKTLPFPRELDCHRAVNFPAVTVT